VFKIRQRNRTLDRSSRVRVIRLLACSRQGSTFVSHGGRCVSRGGRAHSGRSASSGGCWRTGRDGLAGHRATELRAPVLCYHLSTAHRGFGSPQDLGSSAAEPRRGGSSSSPAGAVGLDAPSAVVLEVSAWSGRPAQCPVPTAPGVGAGSQRETIVTWAFSTADRALTARPQGF
jgi:hypothetical protein